MLNRGLQNSSQEGHGLNICEQLQQRVDKKLKCQHGYSINTRSFSLILFGPPCNRKIIYNLTMIGSYTDLCKGLFRYF